ncbi:hypothetical protein Sjap_010209 [Stephania japonica]|uniref:Serine-threonine/tyrosine-protein kinase catalytic domain-containing protein n=1 Tax=Stephania japonica TaxID=461633 RepID=A0AAP0JB66_9MAGN
MVVLICGLGIKMMMDQLIRGPSFMPPPQARPQWHLNLTDPSPNSSGKVREAVDYYFRILRWILIHGFSHVMQAIGAVFALATVSIPTMNAFRRLATSMDKFSKVASEEKSNSDEDSKAPFPGFGGSFIMAPATMDKKWFVKVGSATSTRGTREFENELNLLSAIRHENLVPLLGYYCENDQANSCLSFHVQRFLLPYSFLLGAGEASKKKVLDWPTRISIALGAARGKFILPAHFCRAWCDGPNFPMQLGTPGLDPYKPRVITRQPDEPSQPSI